VNVYKLYNLQQGAEIQYYEVNDATLTAAASKTGICIADISLQLIDDMLEHIHP
jgi:hypothetical protein